MKKITLIHTVKSVLNSFEGKIRLTMPNEILKIHNLLDDFLATDPSPEEKGHFTTENKKRLYYDLASAELTGADAIVVTCSTLTPIVKELRPLITIPVLAIDEAMAKIAAANGTRIKVLATAQSTVQPSKHILQAHAEELHKQIAIDVEVIAPAYDAMRSGDMKLHDHLVKQAAANIKGFDTVVLAQASMAHLEKDICSICGCSVLSSVGCCMKQIKETLLKKETKEYDK